VFVGVNFLQAQTVQITGTVTSADDGMPIPGASVLIKGTSTGVATNVDGKYSIAVPQTATTLVFSFVGMITQEVVIAGRTVIDVVLASDAKLLEEVVVVGYGVQSKRDVSGAVATVKGDAIKTIPVQSFDQALQGKAAGVNITLPNGVLGNPPVIRVRGVNSISSSSNPLIIVDGVPVFTGDMSRTSAALNVLGDINPSDIASIEVLKDASATAIYGSRAANGVVLITTKKGAEGKTSVNYDVSYGFTQPFKLYEMMNAEQFVEVKNVARANNNQAIAYFLNVDEDGKTISTNWADHIYRTGLQQNHSLTVSGGTKATSYFLSLGYNNSEGMIIANMYSRKSARLNLDHKVTSYFTVGANVSYTNSITTAPNTGSLPGANFSTAGVGRLAFLNAPNIPVYVKTPNGFPVKDDPTTFYNIGTNGNVGMLNNTLSTGLFHPVFLSDFNYMNAQNDRLVSSIYGNVKIIDGLYFRTNFGMDNSLTESKTFWHPLHGDGRGVAGLASNYLDRRNRWNLTNTLNYSVDLIDKLNIKAMVGSEEQYTNFNGWSGSKIGLSDTFFDTYQGSFTTPQTPPVAMLTENYFVSFFGRLNFNFDKKYYVEVSARRDGFSGLAKDKKYGTFGGASVMWNISNEEFIKSSSLADMISDLRLKASFGKVGNISGVGDFASLFLYGAGVYNTNSTLFFNQAGNADLGWETSNKMDIGLAFGFLNDRFQVEMGYYKNDIDGLILNVPQSPSKGIPGNVLPMNVGSMYNKGLEFSITSHNINTSKLRWTTTLNLSTLKNEVTALAEGVPFIAGVTQLETTNRTLVGYPVGTIWGVETLGVDPQTGRRMFVRRNVDGTTTTVYYNMQAGQPTTGWREADGTVSRGVDIANDGVVLGSAIPKVYGGIDNNITFGNLDFNLGLTYALGFYVYNGSKAGMRDQRTWNNGVEVYENYWKTPGDITDIPRPVYGDNISNGSTMVQSQNVEKGDFLKIRNVSLGYTFKNKAFTSVGIGGLRLYAQLFNVYTFTGYTGADPEISSMGDSNIAPGVDRNTVPQARTYSLGVNLTF
jgi:TonB-linked SusC/RagA family outer membrane protein